MTKQAILDKVVSHLLIQGRQAHANGSCAYLAPNGDKCAVGCLISKKSYRPEMEGVPVRYLKDKGLLPKYLGRHIEFLVELQLIHDCYDPIYWAFHLKKLAEKHGLKMPEF